MYTQDDRLPFGRGGFLLFEKHADTFGLIFQIFLTFTGKNGIIYIPFIPHKQKGSLTYE